MNEQSGILVEVPEDFEQIQQTVQMFTEILPELILQDALLPLSIQGVITDFHQSCLLAKKT
ncbi:hypothetical protein [Nostoc sp. UCD121]|uniref:hypothetical protein n=1 Tax=Nostoc sp. UCD121 TaxID=2681305 RepID=UPI001C8B073B|nr:hypothetical protein [Nostoc sp. UCD121]